MISTLMLPYPPSTNGLFPGKERRFKSPEYKAWTKSAYEMRLKQLTSISRHYGKVHIILRLKAPTKARSDIDNRIKAILDFLVESQTIMDDDCRYVRSIHTSWDDEMEIGCLVQVLDI